MRIVVDGKKRIKKVSVIRFHALAVREGYLDPFTVVFYGLQNFRCKTAQFCVTPRKSEMAETPSLRNGAQACEYTRKKSFLN